MPRILKRPRAQADIDEIWDFIADDSEERADSFIDTLDGKLQALAQNPKLGRHRDELAKGMRSFPVGRYVIFYLALADGIEVARVLHGARDLAPLFRRED
jgi:toxin ParE1/3/4